MKLTLSLLLLSIVIVTGCGNDNKQAVAVAPAAPANPGPVRTGMDSPIIVSDGSTKVHMEGPNFSGKTETESDGGYTVSSLDCNANRGFDCKNGGQPIPLNAGWQILVYDKAGATGTLLVTLSSNAGQDLVNAAFKDTPSGPFAEDDQDNWNPSSHKNGFFYKASSKIKSFHLVNPSGGTGDGKNYDCTPTTPDKGHQCKFTVHYHN